MYRNSWNMSNHPIDKALWNSSYVVKQKDLCGEQDRKVSWAVWAGFLWKHDGGYCTAAFSACPAVWILSRSARSLIRFMEPNVGRTGSLADAVILYSTPLSLLCLIAK